MLVEQKEKTIEIKRYQASDKKSWDEFVLKANNTHFMFLRDYMEYHSDRFQDYSLMIYQDQKLISILPANIQDQKLYSHQGLSFGGFLFNSDLKAITCLEIFTILKDFLKKESIQSLRYKTIPAIYRQNPGDEDLYALNRMLINSEAKIIHTDIHSAIKISQHTGFSKGKRSAIKKAKEHNLIIEQSEKYPEFFAIMHDLLTNKYAAKATHRLEEMILLKSKFPENIKLYTASLDNEILAGTIIYETPAVAKTQYISSTEQGRDLGAVDFLINQLIEDVYKAKDFFDFGTSIADTEQGFNPSLMMQKELFGARAINAVVFEILA